MLKELPRLKIKIKNRTQLNLTGAQQIHTNVYAMYRMRLIVEIVILFTHVAAQNESGTTMKLKFG